MIKYLLIGCLIGVVVILLVSKMVANAVLNAQLRYVKKRVIKIGQNEGLVLRECPFCGGNYANIIKDCLEDGTEVYKLTCDQELGGCGGSTSWNKDPVDAILLWNARPEDYNKGRIKNVNQE